MNIEYLLVKQKWKVRLIDKENKEIKIVCLSRFPKKMKYIKLHLSVCLPGIHLWEVSAKSGS